MSGRHLVGLTALVTAAAVGPFGAATQERTPQAAGARIVAFLNEPREPEFGEVFRLDVQLRVAPEMVVFLSDTMVDAANSVSAGAGTWTVEAGPADSLDVRASYPVMGLLPGAVELPFVEVRTRPAAPGDEPGVRPSSALDAGAGDAPALERALLYLGGVFIMPPSAMVGDDAILEPRPPADVLGRAVSPWLVAVYAVLAAAAAAVAWLLVVGRSGARAASPVVLSPRAEALRELDRIRELDWHANGRVVDFYDATTGVLRRYAERREPEEWRTALTSTELLGRLQMRRGADAVAALDDTVWTAECVKFGSRRPDADAAVTDWSRVRAWIAGEAEDA
jgi:hypothetical protein